MAISITVGTSTLALVLSTYDADRLSCFLSVTNTPPPQANYPPGAWSVLPILVIKSDTRTFEIRMLSTTEIGIEDVMKLNHQHFVIETSLANLLSEEIAAKLGSLNINSITPLPGRINGSIPPTFNISFGSDKKFPIEVDLFGDKTTFGFSVSEAIAREIAEILKNRKPRYMEFGDRMGHSWSIYWTTPHDVDFYVVHKTGGSNNLTFDGKIADRLSKELLSILQIQTTTVNVQQIPIYIDPKDLEEIRTWEDPSYDFEKEMRKRKDKELGRLLGF